MTQNSARSKSTKKSPKLDKNSVDNETLTPRSAYQLDLVDQDNAMSDESEEESPGPYSRSAADDRI